MERKILKLVLMCLAANAHAMYRSGGGLPDVNASVARLRRDQEASQFRGASMASAAHGASSHAGTPHGSRGGSIASTASVAPRMDAATLAKMPAAIRARFEAAAAKRDADAAAALASRATSVAGGTPNRNFGGAASAAGSPDRAAIVLGEAAIAAVVDQLQKENEMLRSGAAAHSEAQEQLAEVRSRLEAATAEHSRQMSRVSERARTELEAVQKAFDEKTRALQEKSRELRDANLHVDAKNSELDRLERELIALKAEKASAASAGEAVTTLRAQLETKATELREVVVAKELQIRQLAEANSAVQRLDEDKAALRAELAAKTAELGKAVAAKEEQALGLQALREAVLRLDAQRADLAEQLAALKVELEAKTSELGKTVAAKEAGQARDARTAAELHAIYGVISGVNFKKEQKEDLLAKLQSLRQAYESTSAASPAGGK